MLNTGWNPVELRLLRLAPKKDAKHRYSIHHETHCKILEQRVLGKWLAKAKVLPYI